MHVLSTSDNGGGVRCELWSEREQDLNVGIRVGVLCALQRFYLDLVDAREEWKTGSCDAI